MYESLHICVYTTWVPGACGSYQRVSDPPELDLQAVNKLPDKYTRN